MLTKLFSVKRNRVMAVVLGLALLLTLSAIAISTTLAAKNEIVEEFSIPDSDPNIRVIEVGQTLTRPVGGAYNWANSNPGALSMTAATGSISAVLTGQQAGNAVISVGTRTGIVQGLKYQITNSNNITKYILSNGGEGIIGKVGGTLTIPIRTFVTPFGASNPEETAFAKNTITWSSFRQGDPVASVSASGVVTGLSKGATILIGKFTDKWGQPQEAHFLVAVGVSINDSDLGKLLELIEEAQNILALDPNPYTPESLSDLEDALDAGIDALDGTDGEIATAIDGLEDALDGLVPNGNGGGSGGNGGLLGPDDNGNYYRPVGDPENVYEVVDGDGNSKQPPEYVYDEDGDPTDGNGRPAYPDGNGNYYVEDPAGSNIYKKVDHDGDLIDSPAIWGGPDHKLDADDKPVVKYGDDYYISLGQNIFQKVDKSNPTTLGPLVGGGPDCNPATEPVQPITKIGDTYYVGPITSGGDTFYYGDKLVGGDGKVNSTTTALEGTDEKFWLWPDGTMHNERPNTAPTFPAAPTTTPTVANTGRLIDGTKIDDSGSDWLEIATSGEYSLIIRKNALSGTVYYENALRTVQTWYASTLPATSALRPYISKNDAGWKNGDINSLTNGLSKPTGVLAGTSDNDTCFLLSYGEFAQFCSKTAVDSSNQAKRSSGGAQANADRVTKEAQWSSTYVPSSMSGYGYMLDGAVNAKLNTASTVHPAMWILSSAFDTLGK